MSGTAAAQVRTPRIIWGATSRQVLTMEWIDGIKLTDEAKMAAAGLEIVDFVNVRGCGVPPLAGCVCCPLC